MGLEVVKEKYIFVCEHRHFEFPNLKSFDQLNNVLHYLYKIFVELLCALALFANLGKSRT